jgi:hypothetical protein
MGDILLITDGDILLNHPLNGGKYFLHYDLRYVPLITTYPL